jgi:DNA (cytosine-5)-methyltransferase 1
MKYISLFSGIGGFELAIHRVYPDAECIGFSEIDPHALQVYKHHFPDHYALGDITRVTEIQLREICREGCDLVVAGFPCTNLSRLASISGDSGGLMGKQSGLFYDLLRVLLVVQPANIVIENNHSMNLLNRQTITSELSEAMGRDVKMTLINAAEIGVQTRRRIYWSTYDIDPVPRAIQTWHDVLEPLEDIYKYIVSEAMITYNNKLYPRTGTPKPCLMVRKIPSPKGVFRWRYIVDKKLDKHMTWWERSFHSDTMDSQLMIPYPVGKSRTIVTTTGNNNLIIDRRIKKGFIVRSITPLEKERLFFFPEGWTSILKYKTLRGKVLGNSVVVAVVEHVLRSIR